MTSWDFAKDEVTVTFEPGSVEAPALRDAIQALGYEVDVVASRNDEEKASNSGQRLMFREDLPPELADALRRARARNRILVVDFWATWCAPCQKLKTRTLGDDAVKVLLDRSELVLVDVDRYASMARAWGVKSVPDVVFMAPDGRVLDRLHGFEGPGAFAQRLRSAIEEYED